MTRLAVGLLLVAFTAGSVRADEKDEKIAQLQAQLEAAKKELDVVRDRNEKLEKAYVALVVEAENAKREAVRAENEAKLARAIADDHARKVEELVAWARGLKLLDRVPLDRVPQAPPPRPKGRQPAPLPEGVRGAVTDVAGELLTINIGADVGLEVGTVLDLYRVEGGGKFLGTVRVTSALNLFPKQAIVTFTPARNVPIDKLRPEELPRKGDVVRPQDTKP